MVGTTVGLIPARGGSKRIPRKNIKSFLGTPLIERTISTMLDSGVFDRVVVSTDDDEIADVATGAGAETPFRRPAELSDDDTGTGAVIRHAIAALEAPIDDTRLDTVCLVYPAAVFVTPVDLRESHAQLRASDCDYVFAATTFPAPIQRAIVRDEHGRCSMLHPEHLLTRSQDLPETFHDVGQFYWGRRDSWVAGTPVMTGDSRLYEIPRWRVQDIDTPDDWTRAELLYQLISSSGTRS